MPGFIGLPELLLLGLLALILFGPKRLPEMGRGLGKGLREFKESVSGDHTGLLGLENHGIDVDKLAVPVASDAVVVEPSTIDKAA
jgi:sec-independent protein translocase protein TatA